jgi:hypothetical protein
MGLGKRTTALLGFGLLLIFFAPAWSADSTMPAANAQTTTANPYGNSLLGMLSTVLTGTTTDPGKPENHCKPSQLYSQHDVIGDPEACIMGRYTLGTGATGFAAGVR